MIAATLASPPLSYAIRRVTDEQDIGYIRHVWRESAKSSPRLHNTPWTMFKATVGKRIGELVDSPTTELLAAYDGAGKILGWCALTRWRALTTVHYVYTRHDCDGTKVRRQGVMTAILRAANVGPNVAYTFQGVRRQHGLPSTDIALAAWAREQGTAVTYVPLEEWLR